MTVLKSTASRVRHVLSEPNSKNLTIIAISALLLAGAGTAIYLKTAKVATADDAKTPSYQNSGAAAEPELIDEHFRQAASSHIRFISLEALSGAKRTVVAGQLQRLRQTGSSSGGVLTREFKSATHAKMTYRFGRRQPLALTPLDTAGVLPLGFVLTGREFQGERSQAGEFSKLYRLFENPSDKTRIEIIETAATSDAPIELIQELFSDRVHDIPVKFERMVDKKGVRYYGAEFALANVHYVVNTKGLASDEMRRLVERIIQQKLADNP